MTAKFGAGPGGTHLDDREGRDPERREAELLARLPAQVACAQQTFGFNRILAGIDAAAIVTREALAALPVTRKSDLKALQDASPPWGGLAATPTSGNT